MHDKNEGNALGGCIILYTIDAKKPNSQLLARKKKELAKICLKERRNEKKEQGDSEDDEKKIQQCRKKVTETNGDGT